MYSLECPYYDKEFNTLEELIEDVSQSGMDPNYMITRDGVATGEILWDFIEV